MKINSRRAGSIYLATFFGLLAVTLFAGLLASQWDSLNKAGIALLAMLIGSIIGMNLMIWLVEFASNSSNSQE